MKKQLVTHTLIVKKSHLHGYGVFAGKTFKKGDVIEECYIIIGKGGDRKLEDYYFDVAGKYAIFTGYGMIYNHAEEPNADYYINYRRRLVTFKANQTIKKGQEIYISYGDRWFSDRGLEVKE